MSTKSLSEITDDADTRADNETVFVFGKVVAKHHQLNCICICICIFHGGGKTSSVNQLNCDIEMFSMQCTPVLTHSSHLHSFTSFLHVLDAIE